MVKIAINIKEKKNKMNNYAKQWKVGRNYKKTAERNLEAWGTGLLSAPI